MAFSHYSSTPFPITLVTISLVAAASENNVIGSKGKIPWHLPADLQYFRKLTEGHTVIMGRKTYESIGHPLKNRRNIVITRQKDFQAEGCEVVASLEDALKLSQSEEEVFVIGGGEIFKQVFPLANRIYLTRVHAHVEGQALFLEISEDWVEVSREPHEADAENPHAYTFLVYERRK